MDVEIEKLALAVIDSVKRRAITVATAESCTGGWIAKCLTDISGSSAVYVGSLVAYSNEIKENLLGVSAATLEAHGAVSAETAAEMAKNCAQSFGVDFALSVTGIAGPGGGTVEKPVGLVFMGVSYAGTVSTHEFHFDGSTRNDVRHQAVVEGLKLIL